MALPEIRRLIRSDNQEASSKPAESFLQGVLVFVCIKFTKNGRASVMVLPEHCLGLPELCKSGTVTEMVSNANRHQHTVKECQCQGKRNLICRYDDHPSLL